MPGHAVSPAPPGPQAAKGRGRRVAPPPSQDDRRSAESPSRPPSRRRELDLDGAAELAAPIVLRDDREGRLFLGPELEAHHGILADPGRPLEAGHLVLA